MQLILPTFVQFWCGREGCNTTRGHRMAPRRSLCSKPRYRPAHPMVGVGVGLHPVQVNLPQFPSSWAREAEGSGCGRFPQGPAAGVQGERN